MQSTECIFCRIIRKEIPAQIAAESEKALAFHDLNPQAPVHILIVPKVHVESINGLNDDLSTLLAPMTMMAQDLARKHEIDQSGYRVVMNTGKDAGQSVFHLHMHLVGGRPMKWPPG